MNSTLHKIALNPLWGLEKALLLMRSKAAMGKNDIVLAMYPKTGSTWIRYFIFNLLNNIERKSFEPSIDLMNSVMPEFGHQSLFGVWPFESVPKLVKTHRPANWLTRNNRAVLVVRDPRDIVVSYYHYANAKKELNYKGRLIDVINHPEMGFEYFFRHYNSWRNVAGLVLRYEDLKCEPVLNYRVLCEFLGIEASDEEIARALELSDLRSMREAQASSAKFKRKFKDNFIFARKGKCGEWKEVFGAQELEIWEKYRRANQFSLYT